MEEDVVGGGVAVVEGSDPPSLAEWEGGGEGGGESGGESGGGSCWEESTSSLEEGGRGGGGGGRTSPETSRRFSPSWSS